MRMRDAEVQQGGTYRERVEAFLAGRVPNLISQHAVLQATLLREESSSNCGLLVRLELIRDLWMHVGQMCERQVWRLRTNRSTIDDFPTAASPVGVQAREQAGCGKQPRLVATHTTMCSEIHRPHAHLRGEPGTASRASGGEKQGRLTKQHQLHLDGPLCRAGSSVGHVYVGSGRRRKYNTRRGESG